jgi:hypothetical protein
VFGQLGEPQIASVRGLLTFGARQSALVRMSVRLARHPRSPAMKSLEVLRHGGIGSVRFSLSPRPG